MPPTLYSSRSGACRRLLLAQGDRLGVEFFDFVLGGRGGRGRCGDFDFDEGFGEGFRVDIAQFIQGLSVGVDREEVAAGGGAGEKW